MKQRPHPLHFITSAGLAAGLLLSGPSLVQAQTTVAGVTSGALSVDETGSASYTLPIAVPPGIAGMQPSVALVYQSHGGNGTAGVGWGLSAASSIHRCGQTLVQDGAIHGVDFSADDRFCLDGQRLVAIAGTYGADGTEYRTEIESFARIISHGSAGTGPLSFTVETKSGRTMEYGGTADARLGVPGASEIRLWSLSEVADTVGNAMTYHYVEDTGDKSYRLDRIEYTRNDGQSVAPQSEVRFVYEARPDTRTSYLAGAELAMTKHLAAIETWTDSGSGLDLIKSYDLTYEASPTTSRSRLTAVTECDANNNCLQPVNLGWQGGTGLFTTTALAISQYGTANSWTNNDTYPRTLADVNGDGLPDIVGFASDGVVVSLSTGSSFAPLTMWRPGQFGTSAGGWSDNDTYPRMLADVNGDGLPDIVGFASTGVYVALSTGASFAPATRWIAAFGGSTGGWISNSKYPRMLADVNGDGLMDIVGFASNGVAVALSTGSTFAPTPLWPGMKVGTDWQSQDIHPRMLADANGDGLADIVGFGSSGVHFAPANEPAPDLLTSITDSLGRVSTIDYAPLTDGDVYSKDSDAVFPVVDIQAPLYVVESASSDDGLGGQKVTSYEYAGAKVHVQGRGFRGFRQMSAIDQQTGIVTTTEYSQEFPTTAQVLSSVKTLADGTTIKTLANTWDALSLNNGATVWPYVAASVSEDYEPNDGPANTPVVTRTATASFDNFGNPTALVTETVGGAETFTETTANTYSNDTINWFLGLLTRTEVTRTRPAP